MTLAEGYILFDKNGNFDKIRFKANYQPRPGFRGDSREKQAFYKSVEDEIKAALKID